MRAIMADNDGGGQFEALLDVLNPPRCDTVS